MTAVQTAAGAAPSPNGSSANGTGEQLQPRVVVVGTRQSLRGAIETRLARDFDVHPIRRGDDLCSGLEEADAVVVVDVARPWNLRTRYSSTLRAIASVLIRRKPKVVVCVTYGPGSPVQRRRYLSHCDEAEEELRTAGITVVALRPRVIVGTPGSRGPNDGALFSRIKVRGRPLVLLPGDGQQRATPVCLGDIAELVATSINHPPRHEGAIVEVAGPHQMSLDHFARKLNGRATRCLHLPAPLLSALRPRKRFLPTKRSHPAERRRMIRGVPMSTVADAWTPGTVRVRSRSWYGPVAFTTWYRLGTPMIFTALYVGLVGLFALWIGVADVFAVSELGQRLASGLLMATGLLLLAVTAVLLFASGKVRYAIGFVAAWLGAAFGVMLVGLALSSRDPKALPVWIAVAACGVAAALTLRNRAGPELATLLQQGKLKFLTSIVSVGALVGFGQWWYSTQYVPPSALPTLTVTAKLTPAGKTSDGKRLVVNGEVTVTNQNDRPANVVASQYELVAARVTRRPPADTDLVSLAAAMAPGDTELQTSSVVRREDVIEIGVPIPSGSYLAPKDSRTVTFSAYLPPGFDVARLHGITITSRRKLVFDRKTRFEKVPGGEVPRDLDDVEVDDAGTIVTHRRPIHEPSLLRRLTRGDRVLLVRRATTPGGTKAGGCYFSPHLDASIDREARVPDHPETPACDDINTRLEQYYGLVSSDAATEVDLHTPGRTTTSTSPRP